MAKSIFTTLEEGTLEVVHIGNEIIINLPEWFTEAGEVFESEEGMLKWAQDNEFLLPALQSAIQAKLIDIRAVARPTTKTYGSLEKFNEARAALKDPQNYHIDDRPTKLQISKNIIADKVNAQNRVYDHVWAQVKRPGAKTVISEDKALETLAASGKSDEELMELLRKKIEAKKAGSVQ